MCPVVKMDARKRLQRAGGLIGILPALMCLAAIARAEIVPLANGWAVRTGTTEVRFDGSTGQIKQLLDRRSGLNFVAPEQPCPLFRLALTKPELIKEVKLNYHNLERAEYERPAPAGNITDATAFSAVHFAREGVDALRIVFEKHAALPLLAEARVTASADGKVRFRFKVENKSDWTVAGIRYPQWAVPAALDGEAGDDCALWPAIVTDGSLIEGPSLHTQERLATYPRQAGVQFTAYYNNRRQSGIYLATEDAAGHVKNFDFKAEAGRWAQLLIDHRLPEVRRPVVELPYDTVVTAFRGDWHDAADLYKAWAKQQYWCAKTLAQRADIPAFLKEGAVGGIYGVSRRLPHDQAESQVRTELPDLAADYQRRTGAKHFILVPYGWEKNGQFVGGEYLPAFPSSQAWAAIAPPLAARGIRLAMLTSGYKWDIRSEGGGKKALGVWDDSKTMPPERYQALLNAAVKLPSQRPWMQAGAHHEAGFSPRGNTDKTFWCRSPAASQEFLRQQFMGVLALGVPLVSFDQEIGGGQLLPCYAKDHGHEPGFGSYMMQDFRKLCGAMLAEGKRTNPDFGLFLENVSEMSIPEMATFWGRQSGIVETWPRLARTLGLFSYLYHEYIPVMGAACVQGIGNRDGKVSPEARVYLFANNLVRGQVPMPFLNFVPLNPGNEGERMQAEAYFSYARPIVAFPEYLARGITRRPPVLKTDDVTLTLEWSGAASDGFKAHDKQGPVNITVPALAHGAYEAADGSLGVIIANTTAQLRAGALLLPYRVRLATIYRGDRTLERECLNLAGGAALELKLGPLETRMLILPPATNP